jgi:triacylglycerol lipase
MEFSDSGVVPYGLLVMHAMDIYRGRTCPPAPFKPPAPPPGGGTIIGYLMGVDTVLLGHPQFSPGQLTALGQTVCYGTVIRRSDTEVAVSVRGTDGFVEWVEDGQFLPIPYNPNTPLAGGGPAPLVEQGFWGIYGTLQLADPAGALLGSLASALPALLKPTDHVVVAGHSLGATLATYLTLDLVRGPFPGLVSGCFFASPHPGNAAFATLFDQTVKGYQVYNYIFDIVPRVPPRAAGYVSLRKLKVIQPATAQADIRFEVGCNHHIVCYLAMLDYAQTMAELNPVPAGEEGSVTCIKGPNNGQETVAKSMIDRILEVAG